MQFFFAFLHIGIQLFYNNCHPTVLLHSSLRCTEAVETFFGHCPKKLKIVNIGAFSHLVRIYDNSLFACFFNSLSDSVLFNLI